MKNPYYYIGSNPTVDLVIINPENKVLMVKRKDDSPACPGMWALPGGFIDTLAKKGEPWTEGLESPEHAAIREVKEETNLYLENPHLIFVGTFEGNNRDPRDNETSWSKSYSFLHLIPSEIYESQKEKIVGLDDVSTAIWIPIEKVTEMKLAFDHNLIVQSALHKLSKNKKLKF